MHNFEGSECWRCGRWGCRMLDMWDIGRVECSGCGILGMWIVRDKGFWRC